jgi:hypothetical protein
MKFHRALHRSALLDGTAVCRTLALLGLCFVATPILAEVSVVTDARGRYLRTLYLPETRGAERRIWSRMRAGVDPSALLNSDGDRMGDSAPIILNQPDRRQPWVLWSASDGNDKEIAYATWLDGKWLGPLRLERVDNPYDDLDPRLAFDAKGRPVAVWWRNEPVPKVFLSVYADRSWSRPLLISDPNRPARFPSVRVEGQRAAVTFYAPEGQTVLFQDLDAAASMTELDGSGPLDGPVPPPGAQNAPGHSGQDGHQNGPPHQGPGKEPKSIK